MTGPRREISEAEWQGLIVTFATFEDWSVFVTPKGTVPGFPNLLLLRDGAQLVVLLKTDRTMITKAQQEWLDAFAACKVDVAVWRPNDWPKVEDLLRRVEVPVG